MHENLEGTLIKKLYIHFILHIVAYLILEIHTQYGGMHSCWFTLRKAVGQH